MTEDQYLALRGGKLSQRLPKALPALEAELDAVDVALHDIGVADVEQVQRAAVVLPDTRDCERDESAS